MGNIGWNSVIITPLDIRKVLSKPISRHVFQKQTNISNESKEMEKWK